MWFVLGWLAGACLRRPQNLEVSGFLCNESSWGFETGPVVLGALWGRDVSVSDFAF